MSAETPDVTLFADLPRADIVALLARFGLELVVQADDEPITGSFWGDSEAGIVGRSVYVRNDTPLHSLLHEASHVVCMSAEQRESLHMDAGSDDLEEAAVCYLQILLAGELPGLGRARLLLDMDRWGYSFRLGSARAWFENDAQDAFNWLIEKGIVDSGGSPTFALRQ